MLAVIDVEFMTIVEEPSKLPMVLPVALSRPSVVPMATAMKAELAVVVEARLVVWLMPEMILF